MKGETKKEVEEVKAHIPALRRACPACFRIVSSWQLGGRPSREADPCPEEISSKAKAEGISKKSR